MRYREKKLLFHHRQPTLPATHRKLGVKFSALNSELEARNSKLSIGLPILSGILLVLCQPPVSLFSPCLHFPYPLFYAMGKYSYRHPLCPGIYYRYCCISWAYLLGLGCHEHLWRHRYSHQRAYTFALCSLSFPLHGVFLR